MLSNREIGKLFGLYAELLLLHEKDEFLAGMLSGAAYRMRRINGSISEMSGDELAKLFKPQLIGLIDQLRKSGTINEVDELIQLTPPGLFEMMRIRGLGGKKLSLLWRRAKIESVEALLEACKQNKLADIPGFGVKTQINIIHAIEAERMNQNMFHFASVADDAKAIVLALQKLFDSNLISLCGDIRRESTTVRQIEIIAAIGPKKLNDKILRKFLVIQSSVKDETKGHTLDEIPVTIYHTTREKFYYELFTRTGSEEHVKKVQAGIGQKVSFTSEAEIYRSASLPLILPELRENLVEWEMAKRQKDLISLEDIKGVVHNHTTWSDGVDHLDEFVRECSNRGFEYVVISDHSKNAHYAGGINEEKVMKQWKEIDALNKQSKKFKIFKSIECDILVSGELDFNNDFLKRFDLVIVSIHQLLKMDEKKATARLIKAIENPYTTILGHMTGRQLLIRPGYPVNFKKVIDACAANKVVIEMNANPYRLDMDWSQIPYALKKGVMISINPDAHSIGEIDNIRWGVSAARKGGLTKQMTWNAMPLREIEKWIKK